MGKKKERKASNSGSEPDGEMVDDEKYDSLLKSLSKLDNKDVEKKKTNLRTEPALKVSEFALLNDGKSKVKIHELMKSVKDKSGKIRKQLRKISHKKIIDVPLETSQAREIQRKVLYEETGKEISKWDPVVDQMKQKPHIELPLEKPNLSDVPAFKKTQDLRPKTDLERAVQKALGRSENVIKDNKALSEAEEKLLKAMSLEEARERHRQLQKMRVLQSYQESKLKRRAKIKSKKYHRLLKKDKIKGELKEFEEAKTNDPEKALEKLKQLEKMRALERASLKHLNTGKWSKHNKLRAKYDQGAREAMSQQMEINRRLMSEVKTIEEEEPVDSDFEDTAENTELMGADEYDNEGEFEDNPWIRRQSKSKTIIESCPPDLESEALEPCPPDSEIDTLKLCRKDPESDVSSPTPKVSESDDTKLAPVTTSEGDNTPSDLVSVPSSSQKQKPAKKENKIRESKASAQKNRATSTNSVENPKTNQKNSSIDPKKVLAVETKKIGVTFPKLQEVYQDDESSEDEDLDDDDERRKMIAEAFADDDVIADFISEKKRKQLMEGSKDICTFLPGWGHWSGPGMRPNKRLKKKLTVRAQKRQRQDDTIGNAIISEEADKTVKNLMVKNLPFNCKTARMLEKTVNNPIGQNWNSETQFRHNVHPKLSVKMGKIIEPINENALIKKPPRHRKPLDKVSLAADLIPI
ncbi:U3 small nucleolar RNA-associated protein 14 homolog A-like [Brevipalpus obovatus]|uniref:U3 small nucleolar RNA-associated protein 14 homolog A-like n=1 Tax=Brevipalpus obovatus TaxID=246614 RepID=UPI003D9F7203